MYHTEHSVRVARLGERWDLSVPSHGLRKGRENVDEYGVQSTEYGNGVKNSKRLKGGKATLPRAGKRITISYGLRNTAVKVELDVVGGKWTRMAVQASSGSSTLLSCSRPSRSSRSSRSSGCRDANDNLQPHLLTANVRRPRLRLH